MYRNVLWFLSFALFLSLSIEFLHSVSFTPSSCGLLEALTFACYITLLILVITCPLHFVSVSCSLCSHCDEWPFFLFNSNNHASHWVWGRKSLQETKKNCHSTRFVCVSWASLPFNRLRSCLISTQEDARNETTNERRKRSSVKVKSWQDWKNESQNHFFTPLLLQSIFFLPPLPATHSFVISPGLSPSSRTSLSSSSFFSTGILYNSLFLSSTSACRRKCNLNHLEIRFILRLSLSSSISLILFFFPSSSLSGLFLCFSFYFSHFSLPSSLSQAPLLDSLILIFDVSANLLNRLTHFYSCWSHAILSLPLLYFPFLSQSSLLLIIFLIVIHFLSFLSTPVKMYHHFSFSQRNEENASTFPFMERTFLSLSPFHCLSLRLRQWCMQMQMHCWPG